MQEKVDYLIIGGGVAAARCAVILRARGAKGRIVMLAAEEHPPYSRPPLSKGLLLGTQQREQIFLLSESYYEKNKIELALQNPVVKLDTDAKIAHTAGESYPYEKALIATGCNPRMLPLEGSDLGNIFYLRRLSDSDHIKAAMKDAKRAAVIGAGFIGMELASAFAQNGIETTMIVREDRLWGKLDSEEISAFFKNLYLQEGVNLLFNEEAAKIEGKDGRVSRVITKGGREVSCDLLCIGIGVGPVVDFIESSRITIDKKLGVSTDEYLRTGDPDVYAAGDVANYFDPVFGKNRRVEHWDHAIKQGDLAAKNMLGENAPFRMLSYFFSDIFGLHYEFLGDTMDIDDIVFWGSFEKRSIAAFYMKEGRLKAAFLLGNMAQERPKIEKIIAGGAVIPEYRKRLEKGALDFSEAA